VVVKPERRKHVRARRDVICGRRNCGRCTRWYLITDFSVTRWADVNKTIPRIFNPSPVPQGCPRCFLRDRGEICTNCPDIELRQRARKMGAKRAWTTLSFEE
jgi:hypothetical protein